MKTVILCVFLLFAVAIALPYGTQQHAQEPWYEGKELHQPQYGPRYYANAIYDKAHGYASKAKEFLVSKGSKIKDKVISFKNSAKNYVHNLNPYNNRPPYQANTYQKGISYETPEGSGY